MARRRLLPGGHRSLPGVLVLLLCSRVLVGAPCGGGGGGGNGGHEPVGHQSFLSPQVDPIALSPDGSLVLVANTTSGSVTAIATANDSPFATVPVGVEPVSIAFRPDGLEAWVSNHVSDSVSVIDTDITGPNYLRVVATVQSLDPTTLVSDFDEPVGIAFASNAKAYVALSSTNRIAVVDVGTRQVTGTLEVRAQEPRALTVRNGLLYALAFESGNQSELSACATLQAYGSGQPGDQCSLGLEDLLVFVTEPNLPGAVKNIVIDDVPGPGPDLTQTVVPDRDLFVFDTATDTEVDVATGVGTLLYGLAVDSTGRAFVAETDARNDANGDEGDNLVDLDNRMFLDQIARVDCGGGSCGAPVRFDLEPAPPAQPAVGDELATPYGIAVSGDDTTVVATAMGTSRVFSMDASSGSVLDILDLGSGASFGQQSPRGLALASDVSGAPQKAYVLNTLENTVSVVDVSNPAALVEVSEIPVGNDPTPDAVRRGRIAFASAFASSSGTFSCESCHPDGNTDQLLWRIGGSCSFSTTIQLPITGGSQNVSCSGDDEPRSTMPVRGLLHTVPLHWDGTLGDPFGGGNGAVGVGGSGGTDCVVGDADGEHDCFVDLAEAALSGVMCDQNPATNPAGCPPGGNELSAQERDDMGTFLASVSYPPARSRAMDDGVSAAALDGFRDFFMDQNGGNGQPDTCADSDAGCHALPLGTSTNSATLQGFDAPTMRGMTDRYLQFSMGVTNTVELLNFANSGIDARPFANIVINPLEPEIQWDADHGFEEITTFGVAFAAFEGVYNVRPLDIFQMFEEASTGTSGAFARQVTLNQATTTGGNLADTEAIVAALEQADTSGFVNLRAEGPLNGSQTTLSYREATGFYQKGSTTYTRADLIAAAQAGGTSLTLTGALRQNVGLAAYPQPLLSTDGTGNGTTGDPPLPRLSSGGSSNPPALTVTGVDVRSDAVILLDGAIVSGTLTCLEGTSGALCADGGDTGSDVSISIDLDSRPATGTHLLQLQNPGGPLSNELPMCVGNKGNCV
jgi:YVTN family beta-propeller protein